MSAADEIDALSVRLERLDVEIARKQQEFTEGQPVSAILTDLVLARGRVAAELDRALIAYNTPEAADDMEEQETAVDSTHKELAQKLAASAYEAPEPSKSEDIALAGVFAQLAIVDALEALTEATTKLTLDPPQQTYDDFVPPYDR